MVSPLLAHISDPVRRKPKGVGPPPGMFLLAGYKGFDSASREELGLLSISCAKRGITGKQVQRMMVATSARLWVIHCVS